MPSRALSPVQDLVLSAIRRRIQEGDPVPSYRELRDEFGWNSTGTVRDHLQALARKGYIELSGPGHRSIRLVDRPEVAEVPLIGRVTAGSPVVAEQNVERRIPVPAHWTGRGIYFALRVMGDSMVDAGIREGDCVIVRQQCVASDGAIVVATLDGQTTLKRLRRRGTRVTLVPENARHRPIPVESESAVVQGVVVGLMRTYQARGSIHEASHRVGHAPPKGRSRRGPARTNLQHQARKQ